MRILMAVVFMLSSQAIAKDLTNRLGVGVKQNSGINNSELLAHYYPNPDYGVTAAIGIDTQTDYSRFSANGGVRRLVFKEDNMNFYMGGRAGIINYQNGSSKQSGFEIYGTFGGEFFLHGLDSLGFNFEGGVGVVSGDDVRFRTLGDSFTSAGILFYF